MSLSTHFKGIARADIDDFSMAVFEIQVKYTDGWTTVASPRSYFAQQAWYMALKRWPSFQLRCLKNGKIIRESR